LGKPEPYTGCSALEEEEEDINVGVDTQRQISFEIRWIQTARNLQMNTSNPHLRSHITHFEQQKSIKMDFNQINCGEVEWLKLAVAVTLQLYSAVHSFWPVEELAGLADGPTGCGEVARGGCLFTWNVERDVVNCTYKRAETDKGGSTLVTLPRNVTPYRDSKCGRAASRCTSTLAPALPVSSL